MKPRDKTLLIGIAYFSYVLLGLPNGALGVAWPSIRESFGVSLDAVGTLLTVVTVGHILVSFNSGRIVSRLGIGPFLLLSSGASVAGLLGFAVAPSWWVMVAVGLLVGMGAGALDAAMNTYVAANYGTSHMNLLHACFGIGVTLGPAIITGLLNLNQSWRLGYAIIVALQLLLALFVGLTLRKWRRKEPTSERAAPDARARGARSLETLRLPIAWLGIVLFIVHPGIQFTAGQWAYSLFTEARSIRAGTAGLWVSIYWASLTAGRLLVGTVADRFDVVTLLRGCIVGVVVGSALLWWNPIAPFGSFAGLALVGLSLAPLFPSLISSTPGRVGPAHAANAIGFQVAAGSVGIALLPSLAGVLAQNLSLEIVPPFMVVAGVVMFFLHQAIVRPASAGETSATTTGDAPAPR